MADSPFLQAVQAPLRASVRTHRRSGWIPALFAASAVLGSLGCCGIASARADLLVHSPDDSASDRAFPGPRDSVSIHTDQSIGEVYNFWSTRPMVNATRFDNAGFREDIQQHKSYVKSFNLVRMLGGRNDDQQEYFKGVDDNGQIIADFDELIATMRNVVSTGFEPRIVLSKVPWKMSGPRVKQTYGNAKPPLDYDVWRQYINGFLQALVDEFGMDTVKTWRFRVATEPNFKPDHWTGTKEEFFKHYDITVDEVLKVIPEAIVGPGNLLTERVSEWDLELIDHCARGRNHATGKTGTQMDFFAISYYDKLDLNNVRMDEIVAPFRRKLDRHPQFRDVPFEIHEFGILRDEHGRRGKSLSDASALGASWYATVADKALQHRISEIYDWGQEVFPDGLPAGRRNVTSMFQKLEGAERLQSTAPRSVDNKASFAGVVAARKDEKLYALVYNHHVDRGSDQSRTVQLRFRGEDIAKSSKWTINQWTVDRDHGVFLDDLYADVEAAGVGIKPKGRIFGNRPGDRFEDGWIGVFENNREKYVALSKLPQTQTDAPVQAQGDRLLLNVPLTPHCVQLIELTPANR